MRRSENRIGINKANPVETLEIATALDERMRAFVAAQHVDAEQVQLDEETIRRLKALGCMK